MRARTAAPGVLLALLVAFSAFRSGGLQADVTGVVSVALLCVLAVRVVAVERPFAGLSRGLALAFAALCGLGALSLLSALWSPMPARSIDEGTRVVAYALVLLTFGLVAAKPRGLTAVAVGLTIAATGLCVAALATRLAPDLLPTRPTIFPGRLSWPLTYWNALGLLAVVALLLVTHASATLRGTAARAATAALLVPVAVALLLTFSRGSLVAAAAGLALLAALAPSAGLAATVFAAAVPTAVAVAAGLSADLLAGEDPTGAAATAQGHDLALIVLACALAAAAARAATTRLEPRFHAPRRPSARAIALAAAAAALLATGALVAAGVPQGVVADFGAEPTPESIADSRRRLLDVSGSNRVAYWDVALTAFADAPLAGSGAGSYRSWWARERPILAPANRAHSLELETVADLGLIGLALLSVSLAACLLGLWRRRRAGDPAAAVLLAAATAWLVHASADWDWHLASVTLWVFAAGGAALAGDGRTRAPRLATRGAIALALLALAVPIALVAVSQRRVAVSLAHLRAGNCEAAQDAAEQARATLDLRPEPHAVAGHCLARAGRLEDAYPALMAAAEKAPGEWEHHYALAVVHALRNAPAAHTATQRALARNPLQPDVHDLDVVGAPERLRRARRARLYLNGVEYPPLR